MEENEVVDVPQESSPEPEPEVVETPEPKPEPEKAKNEVKEEKVVPYKRFKEVNDELHALKNRPAEATTLAVEDYIDISTSLEGLDQREKAYLAEQHRLSGKPLGEIRSGEDFSLWQEAYRGKLEKERAMKPSSTQVVEDAPTSFADKLKSASLEEKEKLLREAGLYKESRPKADRTDIGVSRTR